MAARKERAGVQHDFCHGPLEGQERRVARLEVVEPCEVLILARATIRHRFASGLDVKEDDAMSELRLDLCISMCIVRWEPV